MGYQIKNSFYVSKGTFPINEFKKGNAIALYVIGSTLTSTIPNISIAGTIPIATLFTPALDVEYVTFGKPVTVDIIPTTPEGIPTPAIITRMALKLSKIPFMVINSGVFTTPKIPIITLPSKEVGKRIDIENALPAGTSKSLFNESKALGETFGRLADVVLIGESIPGGTTTAMAILEALGYEGRNLISSSMKMNPLSIKEEVVNKALKRLRNFEDPFVVNDVVGDPVHISIAGLALGILATNRYVVLAGGTQMLAVLALMKSITPTFNQRKVMLATTKWIINDKGKEIIKFINDITPHISLTYINLSFEDAPFPGLKAYEEGFVKEGVGAGGTALLAIAKGAKVDELKEQIYNEYRRITS